MGLAGGSHGIDHEEKGDNQKSDELQFVHGVLGWLGVLQLGGSHRLSHSDFPTASHASFSSGQLGDA